MSDRRIKTINVFDDDGKAIGTVLRTKTGWKWWHTSWTGSTLAEDEENTLREALESLMVSFHEDDGGADPQ